MLLFALGLFAGCGGGAGAIRIPEPADLTGMAPGAAERIREAVGAVEDANGTERLPAVMARLGMTYEANGLHELALACYGRALAAEPAPTAIQRAKWHSRAAVVHAAQGDPEAAILAIGASIDAKADYAPSHWRLGSYLFDLGRFEEARAAYRRASQLDPEHLGGWTGLARVSLMEGDGAGAVAILEAARERKPGDPTVGKLLKTAYLQAGRPDDARALSVGWRRRGSLGRDPWQRELTRLLELPVLEEALALVQSGDLASAVELLEGFVDAHPDDANALAYLARAYLRQGRGQLALATVREGLAEHPENRQLLHCLADVQETLGDRAAARSALTRAVSADPNDLDAWKALGRLAREAGDHPEAVDSLKRVLALDQRDAEVWRWTGESELVLERWEDAERTFEAAIRARPGLTVPYEGLARARLAQGDLTGAREALESAPERTADGEELWQEVRAAASQREQSGG